MNYNLSQSFLLANMGDKTDRSVLV